LNFEHITLSNDAFDTKVNSLTMQLFHLRNEYENILKEYFQGKMELDLIFPHGNANNYVLEKAVSLDLSDTGIIINTVDGKIIQFNELLTDVQDMIVSHVQLFLSTSRLLKKFTS
jgi:hypothetical protein